MMSTRAEIFPRGSGWRVSIEGGMWGGRHIQWVGGMYCAACAGANGQARWANGQVGSRWVNGEGGCVGTWCGLVCESDMGGAKVVGGHCGAVWGRVIVTPA